MKLNPHILRLGLPALVLLLSLSACSPENLVGMDQESTGTLLHDASLSPFSTSEIITISGNGFAMEVAQDADQTDQVSVRFYTSGDMLATIDYGIILELGEKLASNAHLDLTIKTLGGDESATPRVEDGFRDNSVVFLDLSPDVYDLDLSYGLKFVLDIDNQGEDLNPYELILRVGGGHIMVENIDGRQLYNAPFLENTHFFAPDLNGNGKGSQIGNQTQTGNSGTPVDNDPGNGSGGILQDGQDQGAEAPIPNQHGGHIMVENIDGRQTKHKPLVTLQE